MKKITSKEICIGVSAVGVVICLIIYLMVFTKYNDMTDALKKSNATLKTQVDDMKQYYDNMEIYRRDTAEMTVAIDEMTADYPGDAREEDVLMMAVDMQNAATINYDKINIDTSEVIYTVPQEVVSAVNSESWKEPIEFVAKQATYSNETDYLNLKNAVAKVYESPYRIGVNAVSFKKDSDDSNIIKGTIDITYYSLLGMGKEYKAPDMPEYLGGTTELFGVMVTEKDAEENTAAEE